MNKVFFSQEKHPSKSLHLISRRNNWDTADSQVWLFCPTGWFLSASPGQKLMSWQLVLVSLWLFSEIINRILRLPNWNAKNDCQDPERERERKPASVSECFGSSSLEVELWWIYSLSISYSWDLTGRNQTFATDIKGFSVTFD